MFRGRAKATHRKRTVEASVYTLINNRAKEGGRKYRKRREERKEDGAGKVGRGAVRKDG